MKKVCLFRVVVVECANHTFLHGRIVFQIISHLAYQYWENEIFVRHPFNLRNIYYYIMI